ncbi:putative two-component histidine kinase [Gordonia namibiensis NBRC 108229]|uniref:Putative two-component histidine kinase n=1 Tax=Gordonia namibiensis NBRC 108229 TaxID=1208314 RepID=K6XLY6_9ACTN|nr:sensor histidine kinase [Gordonia namibiensis]GAB99829.1 putative two-component histidine kinase [Gordonia namibiensis NBRC 108229]
MSTTTRSHSTVGAVRAARVVDRVRRGLGRGIREDSSDLDRQKRIGCRFVGSGLLAFATVMIPVAVMRADLAASWWTPVSFLLVVVPAVLLVASTFLTVPRALLGLVCACALGYLAATLLWFPAWLGEPDEEARWAVWLLQFPSVPSFGLVVMLRTGLAVTNLVVATFAVHAANQIARYGEFRPVELLSVPLSAALAGVFLAVALAAVRNVRALDARHPAVLSMTARAAAGAAQEAERSRFAALIHDHVIATLLAVREGPPDPRLAEQAASAIDELDRSTVPPSEVTARTFDSRMEETVASMGGFASYTHVVTSPGVGYPAQVVEDVVDCVAEATRNCVRHAGPDARCEVTAEFGRGFVKVTVVDDGVGFDPAVVDPRRFGIAVGIRARMAGLPGGSAEIKSAPGQGTAVTVEWRRP